MPNWCNNHLTISHTDPAMIDRVVKAWGTHQFLQEFIPVPQALLDTTAGYPTDEAKDADNKDKHGYANWHDFRVNEWGTKWDVGYDEGYDNHPRRDGENSVFLYFDSAWSPPIKAYEKLVDMGFIIDAHYFEGGCAFYGHFFGDHDGINEDYHEFTKTAEIPPEFCERFGIEDMDEEPNEADEIEE
jgi:hypothetical protein